MGRLGVVFGLVLTGTVAMLSAAPNPGVVFEMELVNRPGAAPVETSTIIEGVNAHIRMGGQGDVIYRGATKEMLILNHAAKNYTVLDEAAIQKLGGQMTQMMAQMEQMMKNVPEGQRAAMEQMMRGRMGGAAAGAAQPVQVRRTAERATTNGFATVKYEVLRGGRKVQDLWVTPWASVSGFEEARPVFESLADFTKALQSSMQSVMGAMGSGASDSYAQIRDLDGFPVVSQNYDDGGQPTSRTTLKAIRRQAYPATEFDPPAGYKVQAMPGM